jgi:filamentous hemagglutinin
MAQWLDLSFALTTCAPASAAQSVWWGAGGSASFSKSSGKASGAYAAVTTTSGLFAGEGGFDVSAGGTTTLTGAALASEAAETQNSLTTAALVTRDLTNSSSWSVKTSGFGISLSTGGKGGLQPSLSQKESGSSEGIARATIAPGSVKILNAALQKSLTGMTPDQAVAALNRATSAQNKGVDALPGLTQTMQNLSDRSAAFAAASSSTAQVVGDIAARLKNAANATIERLQEQQKTRALTPGEQAELDAARWQSSAWGEGGTARVLIHGATQGVLSWLGSGGSLEAGLKGAGDDEEKKKKLKAAACYLIHCADGVPKTDPNYANLKALQDYGATLATEIAELKAATYEVSMPACDEMGCYGDVTVHEHAFNYSLGDYAADYCSSSGKTCTRVVGGVKMLGGAAGITVSVAGGAALCPESLGAGCVAGFVGALTSFDYMNAGWQQVVSGQEVKPLAEQVLESFGMSPYWASLTYGSLNLGATMKAAAAIMTSNLGKTGATGLVGDGKS